jgi:itaconyl-CoA hydratase
VGDTIWTETEVASVRESESRPTHGIVGVRTRGINQRREVVCEFARSFLIAKTASAHDSFPGTDESWNV